MHSQPMPATKEQCEALHEHVTEKIKTNEKFAMSDFELQDRFGITQPFWADVCHHSSDIERTYEADAGYTGHGREPIEINFTRKT